MIPEVETGNEGDAEGIEDWAVIEAGLVCEPKLFFSWP
jgi:hypothetical protein